MKIQAPGCVAALYYNSTLVATIGNSNNANSLIEQAILDDGMYDSVLLIETGDFTADILRMDVRAHVVSEDQGIDGHIDFELHWLTLYQEEPQPAKVDIDWAEAHHDIVEFITQDVERHINEDPEKPVSVACWTEREQGLGGMYELGIKWTNEFMELYPNTIWGEELEYRDTIETFLADKNTQIP